MKQAPAVAAVFFSLLLPLAALAAHAGQLEDGKAAYDRHDYMSAMDLWQPLADQGNAEAQYYIAGLYEHGQGVPENAGEAQKWYRKSAESSALKNDAKAVAVPDDAKALIRLQAKAAKGDAGAALKTGDIYLIQKHAPAEAMKWYTKAADQGNAEALYDVGTLYDSGRGVAQDQAEAMKWYLKAANQSFGKAEVHLGWLYEAGSAKDYVEASRWLRKAAEQGHPRYIIGIMQIDAQNEIGAMYEHGWGGAQDYAEAAKWYRAAAEQGTAEAQYNISRLYAAGNGVARDDVESFFWLSLAAKDETRSLTLPPDALENAAKKITDEQAQAVKLRVSAWSPVRPDATPTP